ncbi:protein-S-isoprenylcysteine methyltransferase [Cyanobium sp. Copco_Reservoir_LC18]|nr:protein-S-isoprenylcysteine methyltransferase [Cyanobium sp. Copco_Reservoir_LC18]
MAQLPMTQLQAINIAKVTTIVALLVPALVLGLESERVAIYLALHISYCLWWLLEEVLFPWRTTQLFTEVVGPPQAVAVVLYVGVFYALPGWLAMANPVPIGPVTIALGLSLYIFGSLLNTAADVQKGTAKVLGATLVADGAWRRVRHVNYLGDLLRYSSFAVIAGSPWAWLLPVSVLALYLPRMVSKEASMAERYPGFEAYRRSSWWLLPGLI